MKTRVILRQDIPGLGLAGDVVEVAPGYARNHLVPLGKAYAFSKDALQRVEKDRAAAEARRAEERARNEALAARLAGVQLTFEERVSPEGHLYGSVNAARIAEALQAQGLEIQERQVRLAEPLKTVGEFDVPVHVHGEIEAAVKVWVVADQASETAVPESEPAGENA